MCTVGPLPAGNACVIQMTSAPTTPPPTPAWLIFPWCPLLSPPWPQGFQVNEVGQGGPHPFCPLSQLFWLVFFLFLHFLSLSAPSSLLRRTAMTQPPTEVSCPAPVWVQMKKGPARDATVVVPCISSCPCLDKGQLYQAFLLLHVLKCYWVLL